MLLWTNPNICTSCGSVMSVYNSNLICPFVEVSGEELSHKAFTVINCNKSIDNINTTLDNTPNNKQTGDCND